MLVCARCGGLPEPTGKPGKLENLTLNPTNFLNVKNL